MDKKAIKEAVKKARSDSPKRNFKQTVDFIINLKDIDMKNPDEQVDFFVTLPNAAGMKRSVCAFVGPELKDEAKKVCDEVVEQSSFKNMKKGEAKRLSKIHDYFIAQANIMPQVATTFGKYLGPRGKMPNPKAGSIVPPNANLQPLYKKLQNTLNVRAKKAPVIQIVLGKEDLSDDELADNAYFVYDQLIHKLPKEENNIKEVYLKMTMGRPVKVQ